MKNYKTIIIIAILTAAIFLMFSKLFATQTIQIVLETGQEVTTQDSNYFSLVNVLIMIISSFLIGALGVFLYYSEELNELISPEKDHDQIMPFLKENEKKIFLEIKKNAGVILQNKLVQISGLSKVKVARIILRLERKKLVKKERYGLTNKIIIQTIDE